MRFAACIALLLAASLATAGAAGAQTDGLAQLLDRMRTQSGPVWRDHLVSTSQLTVGDETEDVRSDGFGVRFATYQCAQTLCAGSYFDGERLNAININGTVLPTSELPDAMLRAERIVASRAFLDPAFTQSGGRVTDDGWTEFQGARYRALLISDPASLTMRVYVDPASDEIRYLRDVNGDETLEYRDYRHVDGGLDLPFLVLRNGATLERYRTRAVAGDPFVEPRGLSPAFDGPPAAIATDPDRAIPILTCSLAGVETKCLLDTGNSGLAVSAELAKTLNAPVVGAMQIAGLGAYTTQVVRSGPLEVGHLRFPGANYVVLNDIHRFGYDIVLGADVLAATRVQIDPVGHTLTFDPATPASGVSVPMHFQDFVPVVAVELGTLGADLAVDTGDESNINLSFDFYSEHRDLFAATEQRQVSGVGGSSVELIGHIPDVRIGALRMHDQPIGTTTTLHSTAYGHLGAAFLSQFTVLLDYARGRLQLAASPASST